jgi:thioredoxin-like negative regulator of GroEL
LQELARSVHAENKEGQKQIKIAKVDGDAERAIISRFNIAGFPSFFLIDGWTVYEYNDGRSVSSMMTFVKGGYKQKEVSCHGEEFFLFPSAWVCDIISNHQIHRHFRSTHHPWGL